MPCTDPYEDYLHDEEYKKRLQAATQAACEMSKLIDNNGLSNKLSVKTLNWASKHRLADKQKAKNRKRGSK